MRTFRNKSREKIMKIHPQNLFSVSVLLLLVSTISFSSAQNLNKRSGTIFQQASIKIDEKQAAPVEVRFKAEQKVSVNTFFDQYRKAFAWSDENEAISYKRSTDKIGQIHHRFKQYFKGIELAEVQYLVHEKEGAVVYAHGKMIHGLQIDVTPKLTEDEALSRALAHIGAESYIWENKKNEAVLKKHQNDRDASYFPRGEIKISAGLKKHVVENFRLVYRFDIFAEKPLSRNYVDVDAKTGEIVGTLPRLYSDDVQGRGTTLYNGDVDIVVSDENYYGPEDPPAHFLVNDWSAYGGSGTSWWMADTNIGDEGGYSDGWYDVLDSDSISLYGEQVILSFRHRYAVEYPQQFDVYDGWDGMNVRISIDDGETWQVLENPTPIYSNESLYSFGNTHGEGEGIPGWTGEMENWTAVAFNLSAYIGTTVKIRFAFASDEASSTESGGQSDWFGWQVDDVVVANLVDTLFLNSGNEEGMTAKNFVKEAIIVDGNYRLRESGRGGGIATFDAGGDWVYWQSTDYVDDDSVFSNPDDQAGVSLHWAVEATYDYYLDRYGRNSFDDQGSRIISYANYGVEYFNAFWNGIFLTFGTGNASNGYRPLVALDVVGHEFTHGVTEYAANLVYSYESGALNESFSDIFGEHIENYRLEGTNDWLMGGDFGAIRSMSDPNAFSDPDTYLGSFWWTAAGDNGGVHINSGVQNFWFYLLSEGSSGVNDNGDSYDITGIGMDDAAQIAYRNLTVYLMPTSQYEDARRGSLNAAIDLFGPTSQQFKSVLDAWNAVGVYYPFIGPYPEYTTINKNYFVPGDDTLIVMSRVNNPKNHELEVRTIIESLDQTVRDTIPMFDDGMHQDSSSGDGLWGSTWPIPTGEKHYTLHTTSASVDSGYSNLLQDAVQFTTLGPVTFEGHFDEVLRLGVFSQRFLFKISLQNNSQMAIAEDVGATIKLLYPDSCYSMASGYREYGDMEAGEIVDGLQNYEVNIDTTCLNDGFIDIPFILEIESNGYVFWSDTFSIDVIATDIGDEQSALPKIFRLNQNYPNPFNPTTIIDYQLPFTNFVELSIYNLLGQKVATLINEQKKAGAHQIEWDASDFSSGVYYYKISAGEFQAVRKMILLR
jgi:Zn-dependent metalloprotease